jgi:uncharacterized protein
MIILLNSSKTMVSAPVKGVRQRPVLLEDAVRLDAQLKALDVPELRKLMHISDKLAGETRGVIQAWSDRAGKQTPAIDAFQGDIYRGLIAATLSNADRAYANEHVRILSGLYGIVRPFDLIMPYRLELMYSLSGNGFKNLYEFWGDRVAATLPKRGPVFDLASEEYSKLIRPFIDERRVIEPEFLTRATADTEPTFVAVHAKVARGAMARWMTINRIQAEIDLRAFPHMGYQYDAERSTATEPVFVRVGPFSLVNGTSF